MEINRRVILVTVGFLSLFMMRDEQTSAQAIPVYSDSLKVHTVKGIVKSAGDLSPLASVNVLLKGTGKKTVTDAEGKFELPNLKEGDVLIFSLVGFKPKEHVISKNDQQVIQVVMDYVIMGEDDFQEPGTKKPSAFRRFWWKLKNLF